ncbi:MAG: flavin reductase family protein [Deltaproteobacteria bacterium]|nr:flavin reductase family protein [Deltaproteobacteria bacterium]
MKDIKYMSVAEEAIRKIKKGAFLTVKAGDVKNTMTIGWATFGFIWQKPIMMVAVRDSRYTFEIIEKAADFTVSIPALDMRRETDFCGTQSGRNVDKFQACKLETADGQCVASPIIKVVGIHLECKIVFKQAMDPVHLDRHYDQVLYPQKDYHTLYFGEVLACYEIEQG